MPQWILASDGQPFRDRDAARIKRDLLVSELGQVAHLEVVNHPDGGYAVVVQRTDQSGLIAEPQRSPETPRSFGWGDVETLDRPTRSANARATTVDSQTDEPPDELLLSPAVRAFWLQHVQALLGLALCVRPLWIFSWLGVELPESWWTVALALTISLAGGCLMVLGATHFLWAYTTNGYRIDRRGVEQVEWYVEKGRLSRRTPRVNFAHLRSVDVDQSLVEMLLNVGTVKLAAGATDGYEVILRWVERPRRLQRWFQRIQQRATEATSAYEAGEL